MSSIIRHAALTTTPRISTGRVRAVEVLYPEIDYDKNLSVWPTATTNNYEAIDEEGTIPDGDTTYVFNTSGSVTETYGVDIPPEGWDFWHPFHPIEFVRVWAYAKKTTSDSGDMYLLAGDSNGNVERRYFELTTTYQWYYIDFFTNYNGDPWEWENIDSNFRFGYRLNSSVSGGEVRVSAAHCEIHYAVPGGEILFPEADVVQGLSPISGSDNFAMIDRRTPLFEEYVYSWNTGSWLLDRYTLENASGDNDTEIRGITICVREKSTALTSKGHGNTRLSQHHTTNDYAHVIRHFGSGAWHSRTWLQNHNGPADWSWSEIDAMVPGLSLWGGTSISVSAYSYFVIVHYASTSGISLDAYLTVEPKEVDIDALIQGTLNSTADLDSLLQGALSVDVNLDSFLSKLASVVADLDAILLPSYSSETLDLDSILQAAYSSQADIDGILQKAITATIDLDALLNLVGITEVVNLDSYLQKGATGVFNLDSLLQLAGISPVDIDAYLQKAETTTVNLDALIQEALSVTANFDSYLMKALTVGVNIDSLLNKVGITATSSLDALLGSGSEEVLSLDALLSGVLTGQIDIDALLQNSGITFSLDIDSIIQKAQSIGTEFDSLLNQAGSIQSDVDAYLVKQQLTTLSLDALLLTIASKVFDLDAYLTKSQLLQANLDSLLFESGSFPADLDSILSKAGSLTVALDAIPTRTQEAITYLDGLLNKAGQTATVNLDAILGVLSAVTSSLDAVMSKTGLIQVNLDKLLIGEKTAGASLDAVLVLALDNANSHYTFKSRLF